MNTQEPLVSFTIHRSLNRPDLMFGCERKPLYCLGLIAAVMIFSSYNLYIAGAGLVVFCAGVYLLRRMAKADPFMSLIFQRAVRYRYYYPARSTPFATGAKFRRKKQ